MAEVKSVPAVLDWTVYAGDANTESIRFSTSSGPWDLTGAVLTAQARLLATEPDPPALVATITATDESAGEYIISWDGDEVRVLLDGAETWEGVWDLQVLEVGAGLPKTPVRGKFTAIHDVTRP